MSDEQLRQRLFIKHRLMVALLLFAISVGLFYYKIFTDTEWNQYTSEKQMEASVQSQVDSLTATNNQLLSTIEENGKQLVSFTEDKIKYINLASELSIMHAVRINKLTVSDVWQEGVMSGMTTTIEVEGKLSDVKSFVEEYCSVDYTNRINTISCRPTGRYAWLQRNIDGEKVLGWFDLSEDNALYQDLQNEAAAQQNAANSEFGIPVTSQSSEDTKTPITLESMFTETPMKVYLVIDFLGRT